MIEGGSGEQNTRGSSDGWDGGPRASLTRARRRWEPQCSMTCVRVRCTNTRPHPRRKGGRALKQATRNFHMSDCPACLSIRPSPTEGRQEGWRRGGGAGVTAGRRGGGGGGAHGAEGAARRGAQGIGPLGEGDARGARGRRNMRAPTVGGGERVGNPAVPPLRSRWGWRNMCSDLDKNMCLNIRDNAGVCGIVC